MSELEREGGEDEQPQWKDCAGMLLLGKYLALLTGVHVENVLPWWPKAKTEGNVMLIASAFIHVYAVNARWIL